MKNLRRGLLVSVGAGAAIYVGFAAFSGFGRVEERLAHYAYITLGVALLLASLNYFLRFLKWHYFLSRLGLSVPRGRSAAIFLSGFALTVTPGKIGEVLKAYLLRETDGVPMARSAPIVVAERVTDLIGCLALMVLGAGSLYEGRFHLLWLSAVGLVALLVAAVASRTLGEFGIAVVARLPVVGKIAPKLREFYEATRIILAPGPLLFATLLSVAAWSSECAAFYVVLRGFPGAEPVLRTCTFIYAAMTIAGALSFLPGGLGVQEGGMVGLLVATTHGVDEPTAFAATFLTRMATLWFAVLVGVGALTLLQRNTKVDLRAGLPVEKLPAPPSAALQDNADAAAPGT